MLGNRLDTIIDLLWRFKPVLSYSKPHNFSTFSGEEKDNTMHLLCIPRLRKICKQ